MDLGSKGVMSYKYRRSIVVLPTSKSVKPNEEEKEMTSVFQQGNFCKHWNSSNKLFDSKIIVKSDK